MLSDKEPEPEGLGLYEVEVTHSPSSTSITVAVCGDPVIGKALVLLLRGYRYDAKFLPASSLAQPGALEDVGLLLYTPQPSTERREALLALLESVPGVAEVPALELVIASEGTREVMAGTRRLGCVVPWPCRIEELEERIKVALYANHNGD